MTELNALDVFEHEVLDESGLQLVVERAPGEQSDWPDDPHGLTDLELEESVDAGAEGPDGALAGAATAQAHDEATGEPLNLLGRYFRDMGRVPLFRARDEVEQARKIEALEIDTWRHLLGDPAQVGRVLDVCDEVLATASTEVARLRRWTKRSGRISATARREFARTVVRCAEQLRLLDVDKRALSAVMAMVRDAQNGGDSPANWLHSVEQAHRRAQQAKNEFVKANLRLVVAVARHYDFGTLPLADLVQEGNFGLMKAVDRFDYRRGFRFSTYAGWWIRHTIQRALADRGRVIRIPVHLLESQRKVERYRGSLAGRLGREPTREELSEATGIPPGKLEKMRGAGKQPTSLDRPFGDEEEGRTLIDVLQDPDREHRTIESELVDRQAAEGVRALLEELKPIEADILRHRFGLDTDEVLTLREIGERYGVSRERIRQIQEAALGKMRRMIGRKEAPRPPA